MSSADGGLTEEALQRYTPALVAFTSETRETVDVGPAVQHLLKDSAAAKAIHVLDRVEVCQWFVQHATDPALGGLVAEVRSQLPTADAPSVPDGQLTAMCIKYKVVAIAVSRERERRAALEAAETELAELAAQYVEDGMPEAEALMEAKRSLQEDTEADDDDDAPNIRDVVIIKGFPTSTQDVGFLERLGVSLNAIIILNSASRFGRKDDPNGDSKDAKAAAKKRVDVRKPENKKGKGGRDDYERIDPISVQIAKELGRLDSSEPTPLRDILVWNYEVPCVEGPLTEDGGRVYTAKETETSTCEKVAAAYVDIVEKVYRYREWLGGVSFSRVPKLRVRDSTDQVKVAPPVPSPAPTAPPKAAKKLKVKSDPEPVKEEPQVVNLEPDLPMCVRELPTPMSLFDALTRQGTFPNRVAVELAIFGATAQAGANAEGRHPAADVGCAPSPIRAAEDEVGSYIGDLLGRVSGHGGTECIPTSGEFPKKLLPPAHLTSAEDFTNEFGITRHAKSSDYGTWAESARIARQVRQSVCDVMMARDRCEAKCETFGSLLSQVSALICEPTIRHVGIVESLSDEQLQDIMVGWSSRGDAEGFESVCLDLGEGESILARRNGPDSSAQSRFRASWYLFQGRTPFPIWAAMDDFHRSEREHYFPPMEDADDEPELDEEEEEEDQFDEDGNLLPKKVKLYDITFQNVNAENKLLVRRRSVFETLGQYLRNSSSEAVHTFNHGATLLYDEHTTMHPDDGSSISTRILSGNTRQTMCVVHDRGGLCTFGFHASLGQHTRAGGEPGRQCVGSGVRCFFTTADGLRVTMETKATATIPGGRSEGRFEGRGDDLSATATAGSAATSPASGTKRSNTPRAKGTQPITPSAEELSPPAGTPATLDDQRPLRPSPPISDAHVVIDHCTSLELTARFSTIAMENLQAHKVCVVDQGGCARMVSDRASHFVIDSLDKSIMLVADRTRTKIFATGDVSVFCDGRWLSTAIGTGNRLLRCEQTACLLPPVLMATTIHDSVTSITRDDGVCIVASPNVEISYPVGVGLMKAVDSNVTTFVLPNAVRVRFGGSQDEEWSQIDFANGVSVTRSNGALVSVSVAGAAHCVAMDFGRHEMYARGEPDGPTYRIDSAFGGLRVHCAKRSFHVTPFGRCRVADIVVEEAPLPTDLTTRHTVEVFMESEEIVSPLFEMCCSANGINVRESLHASQRMKSIPVEIRHLLDWASDSTGVSSSSTYVEEKRKSLADKVNRFATIAQDALRSHTRGIVFAKLPMGSSWRTVSPADVNSDVARVLSGDPMLSDVVICGDQRAQISALVRGTSTNGKRQCEMVAYAHPTALTPLRIAPPALHTVSDGVTRSIPRLVLAQLISRMGNVRASAERASLPRQMTDRRELVGMSAMHANLFTIRSEEPRFWSSVCSKGTVVQGDCIVQPDLKPILPTKTTPGRAAPSPHKPATCAQSPQRPTPSRMHNYQVSPQRNLEGEPRRGGAKRLIVVTPSSVNLGAVMERVRYVVTLQLTNVSTAVCRFKVTTAAKWLTLSYKMLPLAAGMTTVLEAEVNGRQPLGHISAVITVAFEGGESSVQIEGDCHQSGNKVVVPPHGVVRVLGPM